MKKRKTTAAGTSKRRASNPPKRKASGKSRKRRASNPPKKRVYRRKRRASNPPADGRTILGAVLGGLGAAAAGNAIAALAGGTENSALSKALRVAVPMAIAFAAGRQTSAMAAAVEKGAFGAAGVELADVLAKLVRRQNPPIAIVRRPNAPPPPRFANPFGGGERAYPATVSGQLPPAFISPLRMVAGNPYA